MGEKLIMRKAISLSLGLSFFVMMFSGLMLFIAPRGRIAHLSDWNFLGLSKDQYIDIHTVMLFLFVTLVIMHMYNNWCAIVSYLKNSTHKISLIKKEFIIALTLVILFVAGTLLHLPPFQTILDLNHMIKEHWEKPYKRS